MTNTFNFGEFEIVETALGSADSTFKVAATKNNRKGQDVGGKAAYYEFPNTTDTNFYVEIEEKGGARKEIIGVASLADSGDDTEDGTRNIYTLTVRLYSDASTKMRGVIQTHDYTNNISNYDANLVVSSFPVGSLVKIVVDAGELQRIDDAVANASEINDFSPQPTANGAVGAGIVFYLDSSGKANAGVNSGAFDGCNLTATADGNQINGVRYIASGITVPGNIGDTIYADNTTGALQTSSSSATRIGRKQDSSTLVIFNVEKTDLSKAQVEDETSTDFGEVSGQRLAQSQQASTVLYAADAGSNDTYVITLAPVPAAYYTGMKVTFKANTVNTGAATLNVNSLGAKDIRKDGTDVLEDGDIQAGQIVTVVYDGTQFQLQGPGSNDLPKPTLHFSTAFETAGRFTTATSGTATVSFNTNGLVLDTGATTNSNARASSNNTLIQIGNKCVLSVLVKPNGFAGNEDYFFVGFSSNNSASMLTTQASLGFVFKNTGSGNKLYARTANGSSSTETELKTFINNNYTSLVAVLDSTSSVRFYVDNVLEDTLTTNISIPGAAGGAAYYFHSTIINGTPSTNDLSADIASYSIEGII